MHLLTTKEAAKYLGISQAFLERDRWAGARIPFVRVGSRTIRYRKEDLDLYLERALDMNTIKVDQGKEKTVTGFKCPHCGQHMKVVS